MNYRDRPDHTYLLVKFVVLLGIVLGVLLARFILWVSPRHEEPVAPQPRQVQAPKDPRPLARRTGYHTAKAGGDFVKGVGDYGKELNPFKRKKKPDDGNQDLRDGGAEE